MQTIFSVIVRLIEEVWGLFVKLCQFQATRLLPRLPVHGETEGKKEREEKHGSSKNAKSIRGFVTFQSLVFFFFFQSFQRNRSSARLFRVLNSMV